MKLTISATKTPSKFFKSPVEMGFVGFGYNCGGSTELEGVKGTTHLMEHLMCKTFDALLPTLKKLGINYNAYTGSNRTVFWFEGLSDCLKTVGSDLLMNFFGSKLWTEKAFEAEKKVVLQEYGDCFNDPVQGHFLNTLRKHYGIFGAIGLKKDIENFSYEQSLERAKFFMSPDVICEVFPNREDCFFKGGAYKAKASLTYPTLKFKSNYNLPLENVPESNKAIVIYSGLPLADTFLAKSSLLANCLTGGLDSPLYQEIREKRSLSYFSLGDVDHVGESCFLAFYASTDKNRSSELVDVYASIFSKKLETVVTKQRFEDCKQSTMIAKRKLEILPHTGVDSLYLANTRNKFEGIELLSYEEFLDFGDNALKNLKSV